MTAGIDKPRRSPSSDAVKEARTIASRCVQQHTSGYITLEAQHGDMIIAHAELGPEDLVNLHRATIRTLGEGESIVSRDRSAPDGSVALADIPEQLGYLARLAEQTDDPAERARIEQRRANLKSWLDMLGSGGAPR